MSPPLEHDYIGLSEVPSAAVGGGEEGALNLKATELRLGLPGSESPDRKDKVGLTLELLPRGFVSGAKRGFSDAIDGAGKWSLASGESGSEVELGKGGGLFSPRGEPVAGSSGGQGTGGKDAAAKAAGQERKGAVQVGSSVGDDRAMAPAAKAQVVGWPPIRSYRKNTMATNPSKNKDDADGKQGLGCLYVKVSMDGAPTSGKLTSKYIRTIRNCHQHLRRCSAASRLCGSHGIPGKDGLSESRLMDLLNGSEYVLTYEDKDGDWMLVGDVPWEMFTDSCKRLRIMKGSDAIGLAPRAMEKCKNRN